MSTKYADMAMEALIFTGVTTAVKLVEGTVVYSVATNAPGRAAAKIKKDHKKRVKKIAAKKEERKTKREERKAKRTEKKK